MCSFFNVIAEASLKTTCFMGRWQNYNFKTFINAVNIYPKYIISIISKYNFKQKLCTEIFQTTRKTP